jgi:hypothetical protein
MISATGFDGGKNVSNQRDRQKPKVDRSAEHWAVLPLGIGTARRMPAIAGGRHPGAYGSV